MSNDLGVGRLSTAVSDFHAARRKAKMESLLAMILGRSADLLSYDQVRQKFRTIESARRTLEEIPLEKIVGSVGRYTDFSRSFLPLQESDAQRWAQVRLGWERQLGLPPIETYKVGEVYFILDGHHRVSVAREFGAKSIEGYVIPVFTRVPLSPGDSPDDLIIKSEYDDFLTQTQLDDLRPGADLMVTAPGQYQKLLEHIAVHRYFLNEKRSQSLTVPEAAADWYDAVYQPIAALIQGRNLLHDFPGRTVTDLYLWIIDHRAALGGGLGWEVPAEKAAEDFVRRYSPTPQRLLPRIAQKVTDLIIPAAFEAGPPPGQWRAENPAPHRDNRLFDDLLVTVPGSSAGWTAVRAAIDVAGREEARLTGFHVVKNEAEKESEAVARIRETFNRMCAEAGITARLVIESGKAAELICQRSNWVDLVVFRMTYPPPTQPLKRLRSGARFIIRRCSAPVLAVSDAPFRLNSALLSYGPGRKADEALYIATYLAARWGTKLTVLTARTEHEGHSLIEHARKYLEEHGVIGANYIEESGELASDPARAVLLTAENAGADFLVMGGYESGPLRETITGSTVDRVLRSTRRPVLICR